MHCLVEVVGDWFGAEFEVQLGVSALGKNPLQRIPLPLGSAAFAVAPEGPDPVFSPGATFAANKQRSTQAAGLQQVMPPQFAPVREAVSSAATAFPDFFEAGE